MQTGTCSHSRVVHGLGRPAGWVGLDWVGLGRDFAVFDGLGWVEYDKSRPTIFFDDYITYNCKGSCKLNTRGMKIGVFRPISRFISKTVQNTAIVTMKGH